MYKLRQPLTGVSLDDLQALVNKEVRESKHIEYKTEVGLATSDEKKQFFAGVSSFANSEGGAFLIGVKADDGVAVEITGVPGPRREAENYSGD